MDKIALFGGEKAKKTSYGTGKRFGEEELRQLKEALDQNTLFYWSGYKVKEFCGKFSNMYGMKYCIGTSSGTSAIHVALGAIGVTVGDEIITTPITDMGTVIGILYQNAIPVFADLHPHTYNMDPESIESKISNRTKAILVVHLAGNPADMDRIMHIARKYNLKVIEDCAQSYMSYYKGKLVGTIGDIGCFSMNNYKHISTGDGGMCITNDEELYRKALKFADKNYNRLHMETGEMRKIDFIAPNYRMSELQAAVGIAQLDKLSWICERRNKFGEGITEAIKDVVGIYPHKITPGGKSSYWFYMFRINENEIGVSRKEFSRALLAEGVQNSEGYIPKCIYEYEMFINRSAYQNTNCPFVCGYHNSSVKYYKGMCPNGEEILKYAIKIPVNEFYTEDDLREITDAIKKVANYYRNR